MRRFNFLLFGLVILLLSPFLLYGASGILPGLDAFVVRSGSMEPAIETGSVIFTSSVNDFSRLSEGDVITFADGDHFTTHRIVGISRDGDNYRFETKGDANEDPDAEEIDQDRVVGSVFLTVPMMGYLMDWAQTLQGILVLIVLPASLLIIFEIKNIIAQYNSKNNYIDFTSMCIYILFDTQGPGSFLSFQGLLRRLPRGN